MTRSRGRAAAAGLTALLTLLVLVVGLPVLLYRLGGSPLPGHLPGAAQVGRALLHRDSTSVVLAAVRDISWIAWALFTLAVLAEAQAVLRRRTPPRLWLGGLQSAAGRLVALAALTFTTAPVGTLLATPQPVSTVLSSVPQADLTNLFAPAGQLTAAPGTPAAAAAAPAAAALAAPEVRPGPAIAPPAPQVETVAAVQDTAAQLGAGQGEGMGFIQLVTVHPGDCLWTIAQQHLGHGDRYHEIVALNLGHDMGQGEIFTDPSLIQPGWVLHLPGSPAGTPSGGGAVAGGGSAGGGTPSGGPGSSAGTGAPGGSHAGHPTSSPPFSHPHQSAPAAPPVAPSVAPSAQPSASASAGAQVTPAGSVASLGPAQDSRLPLGVAFGTGALAGGAAASLARLRHRQRQIRRRGRRIPVPASAPVAVAEQRLNVAAAQEPVTALRGVLSHLAASLTATRQPMPEISALLLRPDSLELLLASPAAEPPPAPFTVPGGRQGKAWQLDLDSEPPGLSDGVGDLLPGLLTIGAAGGGYLLADLEHLQVTTVDGPASMTAAMLRSAAAELATGQLAGWYDLILVGFPELAALGGRGSCCDTLDAGLDLLAAKAVALRRRLGDAPPADVRYHRLADPADEDWALTLLVSAVPPTAGQLALLSDLSADPGGIAALVPGGVQPASGHRPPASISLTSGPSGPDGRDPVVATVWPLQLEARPQALSDADYEALTNLFATAAAAYDVGPADPPYDGWLWPSDLAGRADPAAGPGGQADDMDGDRDDGQGDGEDLDGWASGRRLAAVPDLADGAGPAGDIDPAVLGAWAGEEGWGAEPAQVSEVHWAAPNWAGDPGWERDQGWGSHASGASDPGRGSDPGGTSDEGSAGLDAARQEATGQHGDGQGAADGTGRDAQAGRPGDDDGDQPGWTGDPAVTGLPGEPAAWLSEPVPAPPDVAARPEPAGDLESSEAAAATPPGPAGATPPRASPPGLQESLRIGVLGTFTINGQPGALLPAQSQLVLALALNDTSGLSNQQLCYLLGADPDRPKPSDSLRQLIVRTRRQLGRAPDRREWIEHLGGGQYALHPAARFDWHEFDALTTEGMRARDAHRLRRALGLIRGRPFTGCYYWWLDLALTETVRAQIVDAADVLAALELAAGDPAAAARAARIGLAGDAGAEQLWRALMRAEHAAGNLSGVREAWSRCLDAISEIAPDGEPHPGTAALYRELLGDVSARPAWAGG